MAFSHKILPTFQITKFLTAHVCKNKQKQVTRWRRSRNLKSCKFDCDFDFFVDKKRTKNRNMASSSFSDAPDPETLEADAKSVTIVINDNGEINYDEKTLQSIIGEFLNHTFLL